MKFRTHFDALCIVSALVAAIALGNAPPSKAIPMMFVFALVYAVVRAILKL